MSVRELQAFPDVQFHSHIGTETAIAPPSSMKKSSDTNLTYRVLGRVLTASLCVFMLLHGGHMRGTTQKDNNHHLGLSAAIVCGMISGVVMKVVDLTQDHGLRISSIKENVCYLVVLLDFFVLYTVVPGGQSFVACLMVYNGLIKGKADTRKHLLTVIGVYSLWIYVTWKGCLSVDWLFVAVTVGISTLWSIVNNRLLNMGDTYVNQFKIPIILLMANFISFKYDRFVAPALIMVAEILAYASTKMIAKTQSWYITSKREDLVAKNYLTIELFTSFAGIEWILAYILMLWEGVRIGSATWPVSIGTYSLAWEFMDSYLDYFNKGAYTRKEYQLPRRILYTFWFIVDFGLHTLFIFRGYGQGMLTDELGLGIPQTVHGRFLYVAALIAMWLVVNVLCSRIGLSRQLKYSSYATQWIGQTSIVRLPAYASSPLLMTATWAMALGNILFVSTIWSHTFPKPKLMFSFFAIGLPVVTVLCIIFHHEVHAIPASQYSLIVGMWLSVVVMTFGHQWWKDKTCH